MTTPTPPALPSARQLFALVALAAVVLAAAVSVYLLTPVGQRPGLLSDLSHAAPQLATLITAGAAWFGVRTVKGQQAQHTQQLSVITHQTNGVLSQRISDVVAAQLDARGLYSQPAQPGKVPTMTTPLEPTPTPDPGDQPAPADPWRGPATPQPAPVEPAPVEPAPVEPAPVEPAPVEPAPVEPAPVEPAPVEVAPEVATTADVVAAAEPPAGPPQPTFGTVAHTEG